MSPYEIKPELSREICRNLSRLKGELEEWLVVPLFDLNFRLLSRWGSVLYPSDVPSNPSPYYTRRCPLSPTISELKPGQLIIPDSLIDEIACEIVGWHNMSCDDDWLVVPEVPVTAVIITDAMSLTHRINLSTKFGIKKKMTDNNSLETAAAAVAKPGSQRISLAFIESRIAETRYYVDGTLTIAVVEHVNGFKAVGTSAAADPQNYNKELGEKAAKSRAIEKLWEVEGFSLREQMSAQSNLIK